jgi:hypothetical protein
MNLWPFHFFVVRVCVTRLLTGVNIIGFMVVDMKMPDVEIVVTMATTQGISNAGISHSSYGNRQSCLR